MRGESDQSESSLTQIGGNYPGMLAPWEQNKLELLQQIALRTTPFAEALHSQASNKLPKRSFFPLFNKLQQADFEDFIESTYLKGSVSYKVKTLPDQRRNYSLENASIESSSIHRPNNPDIRLETIFKDNQISQIDTTLSSKLTRFSADINDWKYRFGGEELFQALKQIVHNIERAKTTFVLQKYSLFLDQNPRIQFKGVSSTVMHTAFYEYSEQQGECFFNPGDDNFYGKGFYIYNDFKPERFLHLVEATCSVANVRNITL